MTYEEAIQAAKYIKIGTKQTIKAMEFGKAVHVFVASDAEPEVTTKVIQMARKTGIELTYVDSMKQLGKACNIEVAASSVALCNEE